MALLTQTFGLFTDTALTLSFGGTYSLEHETDESDNPQDKTLYLGSLGSAGGDTADRKLQASSNPGVDNITVSVVDLLPSWAVATAYTLGQHAQPTTPNTYSYEATTAGTSHATTEPTWPTTLGATVADGTAVWTCVSKKHATTEILLATTEVGLDTATPGVALSLGNTITSGTANDVAIWIRIVNDVNTVGSAVTTPELGLAFNTIRETEV